MIFPARNLHLVRGISSRVWLLEKLRWIDGISPAIKIVPTPATSSSQNMENI